MDNRFGGIEGRRKGGRNSQISRKLDPERFRKLGCIIPNQSLVPKYSSGLAELFGLILGDGGITHNQLMVSLNSIKDADYSVYVRNLMEKLLGQKAGRFIRKDSKCVVIFVSGVNVIKTLQDLGLKVGNKVKLQVEVPQWIKNDLVFSSWCLRGLMDTDGGVFIDKYTINGKEYQYRKICFTNMSKPLIDFAFETLTKLGFHPQKFRHNKVWLYSYKEVEKYLQAIGSSNSRLNNVSIK